MITWSECVIMKLKQMLTKILVENEYLCDFLVIIWIYGISPASVEMF